MPAERGSKSVQRLTGSAASAAISSRHDEERQDLDEMDGARSKARMSSDAGAELFLPGLSVPSVRKMHRGDTFVCSGVFRVF